MFPDDRPLDFNWRIPIGRRRERHRHLNWSPAVEAAVVARERRRHLDAPVRPDAIELRFVATALAPDSPVQPVAGLYRAVPACYMVAMFFQEILKFRFHFSLILSRISYNGLGYGTCLGLSWKSELLKVMGLEERLCGNRETPTVSHIT